MELRSEIQEGICIVHIPDDITTDAIRDFDGYMKKKVMSQHSNVILDMAEIDYFCSSAYGVMLSCLEKVRAKGGDLVLANVSESVQRLFEVTRLTSVVRLEKDMEAALRYFKRLHSK